MTIPISILTSSLPGLNKASSIKSGLLVIPEGEKKEKIAEREDSRADERDQMFRLDSEVPFECESLCLVCIN